MSKYVIECPDCGKYVEVGTGLFAKKNVKCTCGRVINASADKMTSKCCPHCGNTVIYDQSKGESALCPVCHEKINTSADKFVLIKITCPSCACEVTVDKNATNHTCSLCGTKFDVQKRIAQEEVKKNGAVSIIKWEANNDIFVWKHPIEDFNLGSQLIVHQTQEALFFRDGRALDLFGAGRYTLETQRIPLLNELYMLPTNADIALHSEVYFINKTVQTGIKWGTPSRVRIIEPFSNIPIEIGARGSFNLEVSDSRKLILRLVGTSSGFVQSDVVDGGSAYSVEYMRGKFADMIAMNVTSLLARIITENKLNVLTIDTMKPEISHILGNAINKELEVYGLQIPGGQFYVTDVMTPDDDPNYVRLKNQYVAASLDIRDEQIAKAKIEAAEARIMAEKTTEAKVKILDAQTDATIAKVSAQGVADSVKIVATGTSDSTVIMAEGEAERIKLEGKAEADVYRVKAIAEADEMKAKGYTYQDETRRQVSLEAMQNGLPGTGNNGGIVNDTVGLGATLGAVGGVMNMTKEMLNPIMQDAMVMGQNSTTTHSSVATDSWNCSCGKSGITSKFCPECGSSKPVTVVGWNCSCGQTNITSKFCPDCGAKKPEFPTTWTCPNCGVGGITSKFCPDCGHKKDN
jgi:membrane protease subunit (stomatin/prohibitin family)